MQITEISKIEARNYEFDVNGQANDCMYDCAHWSGNTGSNFVGCTVTLDKYLSSLL